MQVFHHKLSMFRHDVGRGCGPVGETRVRGALALSGIGLSKGLI